MRYGRSASGKDNRVQLHFSPASPFVRKVRVVAIETGQQGDLELVEVHVTPIAPSADVTPANPIGKIPCLITPDAGPLYDSRVIAEYLDGRHAGPRLFPTDGPARWQALRRQALADGIMDAAVLARYEALLRPAELRWEDWLANQKLKFRRALDQLEDEVSGFAQALDIGQIATGCALGYLDFRFPDEGWRAARPKLGAWFEDFAARDSMRKTAPEPHA